jgi:SAM-dependent methyltransferase
VSDAAPTRRFSNRVEDYIRWRPSYPPQVIELLRDACGMTPDWTVADIGSGPGNLTRLFLENGNVVIGVEPNAAMRAAGERLLAGYPRFTSVDGTAEATGLPDGSVDLTVAGQAFHWFDVAGARREFRRILREPPWVALVWNERRLEGTPFLVAYEALLHRFGTDYAAVQHRSGQDPAALTAFFGTDRYRVASFPYAQRFDYAGLEGRLLSSSYAPAAGQPGHEEMLRELRRIFDETNGDGQVAFDYDTKVFYGQLAADAGP